MDVHKLNSNFRKEVLPKLLDKQKKPIISSYGSSLSGNDYSFSWDFNSLLEYSSEFIPSGNLFCHFTDLRALHSIINSQSIRLYDMNSMNDPNEFSYIASQFNYNTNQLKAFKRRSYIFSMSDSTVLNSDNILNMWRLYGKEGSGCIIEFEIANPNNSFAKINVAKINYKSPDFEKYHKAVERFQKKYSVSVDSRRLVQQLACLYKKPLYKLEDETRLIGTNLDLPPESYTLSNKLTRIKYDFDKTGETNSYYELPLYVKHNNFPLLRINKIQIGFKYSEPKFNRIKKHLFDMFLAIKIKLKDNDFKMPIFEHSPLGEDYQ